MHISIALSSHSTRLFCTIIGCRVLFLQYGISLGQLSENAPQHSCYVRKSLIAATDTFKSDSRWQAIPFAPAVVSVGTSCDQFVAELRWELSNHKQSMPLTFPLDVPETSTALWRGWIFPEIETDWHVHIQESDVVHSYCGSCKTTLRHTNSWLEDFKCNQCHKINIIFEL